MKITKIRQLLAKLTCGALLPGFLWAQPACELETGVNSPDQAWTIGAWEYPDYATGECIRRLPKDDWFGNYIGQPRTTKLVGDFNGDGCDQDVAWYPPYSRTWIINKGMGGTDVVPIGDNLLFTSNPDHFVATYPIGSAGQEGLVWSTVSDGIRSVYNLEGDDEAFLDQGVQAWLQQNPETVIHQPETINIVAIGDSFTSGLYSNPLANFRERLWQQLFDLTTCERKINLDWVGTVRNLKSTGEPFIYGNNFYVDIEHEGHGGYKSCHIRDCISSWMNGRECIRGEPPSLCSVQEGAVVGTSYTPDVALLLIGMNDILPKNSGTTGYGGPFHELIESDRLPEAENNISQTFASLRSRNPAVTLVLSDLPAGGNEVGRSAWEGIDPQGNPLLEEWVARREFLSNKNYRRYNNAMQQVAARSARSDSHVLYVDQYSDFVGDPGLNWDRIHPSYAGHQQLADGYARVMDNYWKSDGACALPDLSATIDLAGASFLIGDFDGDGCSQDIAYREKQGFNWADRWTIVIAGNSAPYTLQADVDSPAFVPGDFLQFVSTVDLDRDGLLDIVWRQAMDTGWQVNFGDPAKASRRIEDNWKNTSPDFDLANEELVVMFCAWSNSSWIGWTHAVDNDRPRFAMAKANGQAWQYRMEEGWRTLPIWQSLGLSPTASCRVVGNH